MSNLLLERSAQMTKRSLLPREYQQVEYIESTGTQWINSGITTSSGISVYQAKISWTRPTNARQLLGANYGYYFGRNPSGYYELGPSDISDFPCSATSFDNVYFKSNSSQRKTYLSINGGAEFQRSVSEWRSGLSICLFGIGSREYNSYIKIKDFKIIINDSIKRCFVPCYRKSDNTIGMYDIITNHFFTNSGTGVFLCSP